MVKSRHDAESHHQASIDQTTRPREKKTKLGVLSGLQRTSKSKKKQNPGDFPKF
jgi:hypothetical protein